MKKLISFDLKADFGFLKKPDTNEPIYITYNMLHKPALLGIMGAITGLKGFKVVLETGRKKKRTYIPEYYDVFNKVKVGIQPLNSENGNYMKTVIRYNNSVGYASREQGGNLLIDEQTLIKPSYRCFLLLEMENPIEAKLYHNIENNEAEYLPYLGKNDFSIWWDNFQKYDYEHFNPNCKSFKLASLFLKEETLKDGVKYLRGFKPKPSVTSKFMYFENLPIGYNLDLMQYDIKPFAFTDWDLEQDYQVNDTYKLSNEKIIQLF